MTHVASPKLTIVVPTYNEGGNVRELASRLEKVMQGIEWEMLVVDDNSPDGTYRIVKQLSTQNPRIRCIRSVGRRGISGACIEGILASAAPYVAVMDADLQHDETILPQMFALAQTSDVVVATRYTDGGSVDGLSKNRQKVSRLGDQLSRLVINVPVSDPMSGFFMLRRDAVEQIAPELATSGFKILVDILSNLPKETRVSEVAYHFRDRHAGDSKLDSAVLFDYAGFLLHKLTGGFLPVRFLMFALVGAIGVIVHLISLKLLMSRLVGLDFIASQTGATAVAMIGNFFLNNRLTYRDARLKGSRMLVGLVTFCISCSIGAIANIGIANWLYGTANQRWWLAGVVGALMGAVWNYAASSTFVWRKTA